MLEESNRDFLKLEQEDSTAPAYTAFDLGIYFEGIATSTTHNVIGKFAFSQPVTFTSGFPLAQSHVTFAATATWVADISHNSTDFGTVTFSSGDSTGVITSSVTRAFSIGDVIQITAPSDSSTSFANVAITLIGIRL